MQEPEKNKVNTKAESNLFAKSVKGGWWIFASRITQQIMAIVRLVVLARLLNPDDFGLLGLALLTISLSKMLREINGLIPETIPIH